jgi:stearoyl-CoA desaturase (delta-9 desaturase)
VVLFGWQVAVVAGVVHMAGYLMLSGAVNAVAHTFGRRTYDNSATNVQWLALLTGGEGLHNNHHAAPTSARFSLDGGWDPSWGPIRLFERLGWVRIRHREPRFVVPCRSERGRTGRVLGTHG